MGPEDLKRARRIAVAEPVTVPAGIYARRYLEAVGVWKDLKVVPTENVRAALLAVESGNAEAAIVYRTDAIMGKQTKVAFEIPSHPEVMISYPVAIMKEGRNPTGAESFMAELRSPRGLSIFQRHGFIVHANDGLEGSKR
jgi:molybdate transport system substrate-binding protein